MIGNYPLGTFPLSYGYPAAVATEDFTISERVTLTLPADFQAAASNFEVDAFKDITTAGRCLEYFNGKVYFAINNFVYCTKTFDVEHIDVRYSVVAGYPEDVTMIARVNDGLYISTSSNTYFLRGTSPHPEDGGFVQTHIAKYGAIYGTNIRFQADLVPESKSKDTVVLWANALGVFAGGDGGAYSCLSLNQITFPSSTSGTALVTEQNGIYQYVVCYNTSPNLFINSSEGVVLDRSATKDTVVVNLVTNTHSRYMDYAFNSFFKFNNKYYGVNTTGIFLLEGDYDFEGGGTQTNIDASVTTPVVDFNKPEKKQVNDVFINARASDDIIVDVKVNEEVECNDLIISYNEADGQQRRRVKVPRGLQGNSWQFVVKNSNSSYFKLFDLEVAASTLKRTI